MTKTTPLTLADLPAGSHAIIERVHGGADRIKRLAAAGLAPGDQLRVLRPCYRGVLLISICNRRLVLTEADAARVAVKPITFSKAG